MKHPKGDDETNEEDSVEKPWTEDQWERFMKRCDARSAWFGELFETLRDHPDREEIIAREMGWRRPKNRDEAEELPANQLDEGEQLSDEELDEMMRREDEALEAIPAYSKGGEFSEKLYRRLKKYIEVEDREPDEDFIEAYSNSMLIAVKIAGGHGMGYEDDSLCGNIVCCKRSLAAADKCLEALESLKARRLAPAKTLDPLIAECKEVRRLVEEHIADLRSRVWWE